MKRKNKLSKKSIDTNNELDVFLDDKFDITVDKSNKIRQTTTYDCNMISCFTEKEMISYLWNEKKRLEKLVASLEEENRAFKNFEIQRYIKNIDNGNCKNVR